MASKKEKEASLELIEEIDEKIYIIRNQKVMLDSDLAEVYQVETKMLNRAVKRNIDRFPEDFMFQLTNEEAESMRFQIGTASASKRNVRFRPYAFTEHGAVMLASVLNSPTAIAASIKVIKAFIKMRSILALHEDLAERIEKLESVTDAHDQNFAVVSQLLREIYNDPKYLKGKIGFIQEKQAKAKN